MTEMVERVAKALAGRGWEALEEGDVYNSNPTKYHYRCQARVAIAAMREPEEAMLRGGLCGWNGVGIDHELSKYQSADVTWEAWRRAWRGMIDAALGVKE